MEILKDYEIKDLNTFGVPAQAGFFAVLENESEVNDLFSSLEFKQSPRFFLGGGSNVLFTKNWDGIVVLNKLKGIEITKEDDYFVWVRSMGGEIWDDLVNFTVDRGYWGIENLSLVPGTVGGAPIQNIGAYGVELKDTLESVEVYDIETGEKKILTKDECEFGYRDSVFKNKFKGRYFISAITLKLSKTPNKKIQYRALKEYLDKNKIEVKNPRDVSNAVKEIRCSKLPDPKILGNAGSFFKNVFVDETKLEELREKFPEIPSFKEDGAIKIPSGWLIEQCGWKGKREGNVGVHDKQALVLVNYGGATGEEILALANKIIDGVYEKFGLKLTPEVNLI